MNIPVMICDPLQSIVYRKQQLSILDQLRLPHETEFIEIKSVENAWFAINNMQVRGAPAIAIVGCLGLAVELLRTPYQSKADLHDAIQSKMSYLVSSRPTAVNMLTAEKDLTRISKMWRDDTNMGLNDMKKRIITWCEDMRKYDFKGNKIMGEYGKDTILKDLGRGNVAVNVLTHCNTGSLATSGYGTALGVVRSLLESNNLGHIYYTETRPYNQGARLTAYEVTQERMPGTLICDSMVASLMAKGKVDAVVVGADRIASNGDTANKIGTLQIAVVAKHYNVKFYVAAPSQTVDMAMKDGTEIAIEERSANEMKYVQGVRVAASGVHCWNPAFDVTPANLIEAIFTEKGVFTPANLAEDLTKVTKQGFVLD